MIKNEAVVSIDIGGSKILAGIINCRGEVLFQKYLPMEETITEKYLTRCIEKLINALKKQIGNTHISGAGITVPGLADTENGILVYAPYSGIRNYKIGSIVSNKLNVPVFIENDVNACAIAEKKFGKCKQVDDFIWITISNGVGGAVFINGCLYTGFNSGAGEIGHVNVVENGYLCGCGNKGCLEMYASGMGIVRRYIEKYKNSMISNPTAKSIAEAAKKGDQNSIEIYKETGYYLGKAISHAVNMLNPEKVILGGGVAMDMDLFGSVMEKTLQAMVFKEPNKNIKYEKTGLGYNAALIGAAAVAFKKMEEMENE